MRIVIPSVGYADFLAVTLPAWQAFAPNADVCVVTSPEDEATVEVATDAGAFVLTTDAWRHGGAVFNKARALDEAFGMTGGQRCPDDWCLAVDADVWPLGRMLSPTDTRLRTHTSVLYGCPRYACDTPAQLAAVRAGQVLELPLLLPRRPGEAEPRRVTQPTAHDLTDAARAGLGYFQLFASRSGLTFGDSATAGGYDQRFAGQFALRAALPGVSVLHLGAQDRANWSGRMLPRWGAA